VLNVSQPPIALPVLRVSTVVIVVIRSFVMKVSMRINALIQIISKIAEQRMIHGIPPAAKIQKIFSAVLIYGINHIVFLTAS